MSSCRECGGTAFVEDHRQGDEVCKGCGLVRRHRLIDPGEEKRMFADSTDDNPHRSALENEYLEHGLGTTISRGLQKDRSNIGRISDHTATANDRNIIHGMQQLTHFCNLLGLSARILVRVQWRTAARDRGAVLCSNGALRSAMALTSQQNRSKKIYSEFEQNRPKFTRGRDKCTYVAVLYMACREEGFARSYKELARATNVDVKQLRKNFARLHKVLEKPGTREVVAMDLIPRICGRLRLDYNVESAVKDFAAVIQEHMIGKRPHTVAAASIKHACNAVGEERSEKAIAEASGISASTLRIAMRALAKIPPIDLVPPAFQTEEMKAQIRARKAASADGSATTGAGAAVASKASQSGGGKSGGGKSAVETSADG